MVLKFYVSEAQERLSQVITIKIQADQALAQNNGISNPNLIYPGQTLVY